MKEYFIFIKNSILNKIITNTSGREEFIINNNSCKKDKNPLEPLFNLTSTRKGYSCDNILFYRLSDLKNFVFKLSTPSKVQKQMFSNFPHCRKLADKRFQSFYTVESLPTNVFKLSTLSKVCRQMFSSFLHCRKLADN